MGNHYTKGRPYSVDCFWVECPSATTISRAGHESTIVSYVHSGVPTPTEFEIGGEAYVLELSDSIAVPDKALRSEEFVLWPKPRWTAVWTSNAAASRAKFQAFRNEHEAHNKASEDIDAGAPNPQR